jgi:hypothetical protein
MLECENGRMEENKKWRSDQKKGAKLLLLY